MTQGMGTDTALMAKTAGDVDGAADRLTSMLTGLMNQLAPLQTAWTGAGGSSFQSVRERFDSDMMRLNNALRAIAQAVRSAGQDYTTGDEEVSAAVSNAGATAGTTTQHLNLG